MDLTMNVYTDLRLLDVPGAVEALPSLPLDGRKAMQATGTAGPPPDSDKSSSRLALKLALPEYNRGQSG